MPAVSKKQQQLFGIVHAIQKGEKAPSGKGPAKDIAKHISKKKAKAFASTPTKNLPTKVKKESATFGGGADIAEPNEMKEGKYYGRDNRWMDTGDLTKSDFQGGQKLRTKNGDFKIVKVRPHQLIVRNENGITSVIGSYLLKKIILAVVPEGTIKEAAPKFDKTPHWDYKDKTVLKKMKDLKAGDVVWNPESGLVRHIENDAQPTHQGYYVANYADKNPREHGWQTINKHGSVPVHVVKEELVKELHGSKFNPGQTVTARSTVQGLKKGEQYKVVKVDVTWVLGQGYTGVVVKDKAGKSFPVGNPQVVLDINESVIREYNSAAVKKLIPIVKRIIERQGKHSYHVSSARRLRVFLANIPELDDFSEDDLRVAANSFFVGPKNVPVKEATETTVSTLLKDPKDAKVVKDIAADKNLIDKDKENKIQPLLKDPDDIARVMLLIVGGINEAESAFDPGVVKVAEWYLTGHTDLKRFKPEWLKDTFAVFSKSKVSKADPQVRAMLRDISDELRKRGLAEATDNRTREQKKLADKAMGRDVHSKQQDKAAVAKKLKKEDLIPGGLGDDKSDSLFDAGELAKGIEVEKEHTDNPEIAKEIAKDHLTEDPQYYIKLAKMENESLVRESSVPKWLPALKPGNYHYGFTELTVRKSAKSTAVEVSHGGNMGNRVKDVEENLDHILNTKHSFSQLNKLVKPTEKGSPDYMYTATWIIPNTFLN